MNPRWLLIRRLRGPVYLLTFAATALLHQWDILGFGQSWPLYLIVAGVLTLAERASMVNMPVAPYGVPYGTDQYGQPYPGQPYGAQPPYQQPYQPVYPAGTAVVPAGHGGLEPAQPVDPNDRDRHTDPKTGGRY